MPGKTKMFFGKSSRRDRTTLMLDVLENLDANEGICMTNLMYRVNLNYSSLSDIVSRLRDLGLVVSRFAGEEKRQKCHGGLKRLYFLTDKGAHARFHARKVRQFLYPPYMEGHRKPVLLKQEILG
jgi:predicted transcriptional regulator